MEKQLFCVVLAGLESLSAGEVFCDYKNINHLLPQKRNISMVLQRTTLLPQMTVFGNIAFPLKNQKVPKQEIKKKVEVVAQWLKITPLLNQRVTYLSGGEQQRVALARAVVKSSHLLLFDEPLSFLDIQIKEVIQREIQQIHKKTQKTTLYVTHDQLEAMSLADRILVMNEGCIEQLGTPYDVYHFPVSRFVARFVGEWGINEWKGSVIRESNQLFFQTCDFKIAIGTKYAQAKSIGIRPEHLQINSKSKDMLALFDAVVERKSFLGSRQKLYLNSNKKQTVIVCEVDFDFHDGVKYQIACQFKQCFFFDNQGYCI